jgi:hypothetical protein
MGRCATRWTGRSIWILSDIIVCLIVIISVDNRSECHTKGIGIVAEQERVSRLWQKTKDVAAFLSSPFIRCGGGQGHRANGHTIDSFLPFFDNHPWNEFASEADVL